MTACTLGKEGERLPPESGLSGTISSWISQDWEYPLVIPAGRFLSPCRPPRPLHYRAMLGLWLVVCIIVVAEAKIQRPGIIDEVKEEKEDIQLLSLSLSLHAMVFHFQSIFIPTMAVDVQEVWKNLPTRETPIKELWISQMAYRQMPL